jgi:hypothetical protein
MEGEEGGGKEENAVNRLNMWSGLGFGLLLLGLECVFFYSFN